MVVGVSVAAVVVVNVSVSVGMVVSVSVGVGDGDGVGVGIVADQAGVAALDPVGVDVVAIVVNDWGESLLGIC